MDYPTIRTAINYILVGEYGTTVKTPAYYSWVKINYTLAELKRAESELKSLDDDILWKICIGEPSKCDAWLLGFLEELFDKILD